MSRRAQRLVFWLALIALLPFPTPSSQAAGASLSVSPGSVKTDTGKSFTVTIYANAGEPINAASGTVTFPSFLQATSVSQAGSVFTLWTQNPAISGQTVPFGGGLANPGLVGSGKLFSVTFKATGSGSGTIGISGGRALANDGQGTNVYTGASGSSVTVGTPGPTLAGSTITSNSHPNQNNWYKERTAQLGWTKPSGVQSLRYSLTGPGANQSGSSGTTATFPNMVDGSWTFTVTLTYAAGERATSYKIQIDNQAPNPFTVTATLTSPTDPFPILTYEASDSPSGIDHYQIKIDDHETITTSEKSIKSPRLIPGDHTVVVKAVDRAGNSTEATTSFKIEGFPGPVITDYPRFVATLEDITLKGTALFGAKIKLFIDGKEAESFVVKEALSQRSAHDLATIKDDDEVEWLYTYKTHLRPGGHTFSAIQTKPDESESYRSNEVTVRVLAGSIHLFGLTIPLILIIFLLLLVIVGLTFLLIWVWRRSKPALVSSGIKLGLLRPHLDETFEKLEKDLESDVVGTSAQIKALENQLATKLNAAKKDLQAEIEQEIRDADRPTKRKRS